MQAAERLTKDRSERIRLAADRIAMQFKFAAAAFDTAAISRVRTSADSLLRERPSTPEIAGFLAPLAAMMGRCGSASSLLRQSAPSNGADGAPHDALADIDSLEADVSAGCHPTDVRRRLDEIASRLVPVPPTEAGRWQTEYWQLNFIVRAVEPLDAKWVNRLALSGGRSLAAERDVLQGRPDSARLQLRALAQAHQRALPGQVTADAVVPEARVWLMLGDTTGAIASLESALNGARQATPLSTDNPRYNTARLGFLTQAYALHAFLLAGRDRERARRSGGVSATMWLGADPELRQSVMRLRTILK